MQTRRTTTPDHHHQDGFINAGLACSSPEGELIALARSKHQVLTEPTLRLIRETLELKGISLAVFVTDVRPHFRNNILNPSGFLISHAHHFHQVSRPARVPASQGPARAAGASASIQPAEDVCEACKGEKYIMENHEIRPCPGCSTPETTQALESGLRLHPRISVSPRRFRPATLGNPNLKPPSSGSVSVRHVDALFQGGKARSRLLGKLAVIEH